MSILVQPSCLQEKEAVLFALDDRCIPFRRGLKLNLVAASKHPDNPVLRRGEAGRPDSRIVRYYGSVVRIGDEFRMWYMGGHSEGNWLAEYPKWDCDGICYALSKDGIHWEKPELNLVEFAGNKANNLVDMDSGQIFGLTVIHEAEEPNRNRRFKMIFESGKYQSKMAVAFSPDGLTWTESPCNPVLDYVLEMSGLVKRDGCYYANGQIEGPRALTVVVSQDFEHWMQADCLGYYRHSIPPRTPVFGHAQGEQLHCGASLWDRGNVMLGFYGQWHGPACDDRRFVHMDIGLLVTHDALHFHEPIPDFKLVPASEESDGSGPALMQGQGFANFEDQTMFWYSAWREGDVRLAIWPRDRLGYLAVDQGERCSGPHFVSCPVELGPKGRVYVNADGLGKHSWLQVELCDRQLAPIPGYSADDCDPLREPGFRIPVSWSGKPSVGQAGGPVRIKLSYHGLRMSDTKVYAVYVTDE